MRAIVPIPARRILASGIAALCIWLAISAHYQAVTQPATEGLWGAPSPPLASFLEAFLVIPGALAGSALALPGAIFDLEWLTQIGLVLGAYFFWYCVGWEIDIARVLAQSESRPAIVRWYLSAVIVVSFILLPIGILAGTNLGIHSCGVGVPPYWVGLIGYGIMMFWITLGCYFGWLRFQTARAQ